MENNDIVVKKMVVFHETEKLKIDSFKILLNKSRCYQ